MLHKISMAQGKVIGAGALPSICNQSDLHETQIYSQYMENKDTT